MKEHIYTIPINDSFDKDCECPICAFMSDEETKLIEYTLGASMMEPDERERSNASGYCKHHFERLLSQTNKLSLALILETHLNEIRKCISDTANSVMSSKKRLFGSNDSVDAAVKSYNSFNDGCVICEKLGDIEDKFIDNIIELYKNEADFKAKFHNCKGFCIPHFTRLVKHAEDVLSGSALAEFYSSVYALEEKHLDRIQEDITWFTKKFDFRYANEDWKNSRDAVPRTIEKIIGYIDNSES